MRRGADFREMYEQGNTPWDTGRADENLIRAVDRHGISPCTALEIGCGTGDNALWLAAQGFRVTAFDSVDLAIEQARAKLSGGKLPCRFFVADFPRDEIPGGPFGLVFDRGCFHSFPAEDERAEFARKVAACLVRGGHWLSLIGSADQRREGVGPPQLRAGHIAAAVETDFEILSLTASYFDSDLENRPKAWVCLMRKRAGMPITEQ